MSFITTIPEDQVSAFTREQYENARETLGYVPNYIKAFSLRPEVYEAWTNLISAIRPHMRLRRYELVTFASAMALDCAYCMLAHGATLRKNFFGMDQMLAIINDYRNAGLSAEEVTLMTFARKIAMHSDQVSEQDIEDLRVFGLTDEDILDVILACTARNFFSKTLEATGAVPDKVYADLEPELLEKLSLGHPIDK